MKTVASAFAIGLAAYLLMMWAYSTSDSPEPEQSPVHTAEQEVDERDIFDEAASAEHETNWRDLVRDSAPAEASAEWPDGGLGWSQARLHAGTVQRVCGPLMSVRETDDGTFVNVGQDYPSADRFTFIFWNVYLEQIGPGATICGNGEIYLYEGVAQIEMSSPSALEIWQ